eukprot:359097-Chlamydomonas_euryale.AAC.3
MASAAGCRPAAGRGGVAFRRASSAAAHGFGLGQHRRRTGPVFRCQIPFDGPSEPFATSALGRRSQKETGQGDPGTAGRRAQPYPWTPPRPAPLSRRSPHEHSARVWVWPHFHAGVPPSHRCLRHRGSFPLARSRLGCGARFAPHWAQARCEARRLARDGRRWIARRKVGCGCAARRVSACGSGRFAGRAAAPPRAHRPGQERAARPCAFGAPRRRTAAMIGGAQILETAGGCHSGSKRASMDMDEEAAKRRCKPDAAASSSRLGQHAHCAANQAVSSWAVAPPQPLPLPPQPPAGLEAYFPSTSMPLSGWMRPCT